MGMTKKEQQDKVGNLILRGEEIYKKEYQRPTPRFPFAFADGPMYRAWMGEINTLNERYFQDHPLYSDIKSMYEKRNKETHAFEYMVSHLNALYTDNDYWAEEKAEIQQQEGAVVKGMDKTGIFISHSSKNAEVAIMLRDFLVETGVPNECIFCSSIKGNDVKHRISVEVKTALAQSCVNIAILSEEYKNSPYCVNEAGIIWFFDETPAIVIGLPEITHTNMCGFINGDYIVRKLDLPTDISEIYDIIEDQVHPKRPGYTVFTAASQKLIDRYNAYIANRPTVSTQHENAKVSNTFNLSMLTTDDECVVLYYILSTKVRQVCKSDVIKWLTENEIYGINVDNAFDLLATLGAGKHENDTLVLDIEVFRSVTSDGDDLLLSLDECIREHQVFSKDTFLQMWQKNAFSDADKLFITYIIENRVSTFGARWKEAEEIESIKDWEGRHCLDNTLYDSYSACLNLFIDKNLVQASDWTSHGNPKEYMLQKSLKDYLLNGSFPYMDDLQ